MPKFFISDTSDRGTLCKFDKIELTGDNAYHISRSLRMREGEEICVSFCDGIDYICKIHSFGVDSVFAEITDITPCTAEPEVQTTLFQALVKGDKMETIIQKAVELGVYEIYPVESERSVVRLDEKSKVKKLERWNKIALEASKQCGRGIIPKVHDVLSFKECVARLTELDASFFCYEEENELSLKGILQKRNYSSIGFFVGSEGGISPEEAQLAKDAKIPPVTLGKLILRTETAGPAVLSMITYETRL